MKQTAVKWLKKELEDYGSNSHLSLDWNTFDELCEQAKTMEKEQIENAHRHGFTEGTCFGSSPIGYKFTTSEQYYNETFKSE